MENQYRSIYDLLQQLGVTANYTGYFHAAYAVQLCMKRPERLLLVTKLVYPDVAKQFQTTWKAVERNIRTVGELIWRQGPSLLEQLAGRKLLYKPCAAQLLAMLTYAMCSPHSPIPLPVHGLGEPVAFPREDHDMGMVDQPVNEGGGEAVIPKDRVPLAEFQI